VGCERGPSRFCCVGTALAKNLGRLWNRCRFDAQCADLRALRSVPPADVAALRHVLVSTEFVIGYMESRTYTGVDFVVDMFAVCASEFQTRTVIVVPPNVAADS